jgi:hypothetical protein
MHRALRLIALGLAVASATLWLALGRNTGWTKTSVTVMRVDPVTSIEFPEYERRFVPGLDFLALGTGASIALGILSLILPTKNRRTT